MRTPEYEFSRIKNQYAVMPGSDLRLTNSSDSMLFFIEDVGDGDIRSRFLTAGRSLDEGFFNILFAEIGNEDFALEHSDWLGEKFTAVSALVGGLVRELEI